MPDGIYGWRCPCGIDTVCSRPNPDMSAAGCYACKLFVERPFDDRCPSCKGPLLRMGDVATVRAVAPSVPPPPRSSGRLGDQAPPSQRSLEKRTYRCPKCGQFSLYYVGSAFAPRGF